MNSTLRDGVDFLPPKNDPTIVPYDFGLTSMFFQTFEVLRRSVGKAPVLDDAIDGVSF